MVLWAALIVFSYIQSVHSQNYDLHLKNPASTVFSTLGINNEFQNLIRSPVNFLRDQLLSYSQQSVDTKDDDSKVCETKVLSLVESLKTEESLKCKIFVHDKLIIDVLNVSCQFRNILGCGTCAWLKTSVDCLQNYD